MQCEGLTNTNLENTQNSAQQEVVGKGKESEVVTGNAHSRVISIVFCLITTAAQLKSIVLLEKHRSRLSIRWFLSRDY